MRTYNGFVVRDYMGTIDNVQNSDVLSSPVIKVVPRKSIAACDLKDEHHIYVTNNLIRASLVLRQMELNIWKNILGVGTNV